MVDISHGSQLRKVQLLHQAIAQENKNLSKLQIEIDFCKNEIKDLEARLKIESDKLINGNNLK